MNSLGIDTSNYTTSAAIFSGKEAYNYKKLLPVKYGERGLRQSDAVFLHLKQINDVLKMAFDKTGDISMIGVSDRPLEVENSYMPCFLVGLNTAKTIALSRGIPVEAFSHQQGHVAAALYSSGKMDLIHKDFIAFHVSGGTTDVLYVKPAKNVITCKNIAKSLDVKAGQLIDRVGVKLGLSFPCGVVLEKLALGCDEEIKFRPSLKGANCSLSGIENKCNELFKHNYPHEYIAKYVIMAICYTLNEMTKRILIEYGDLPVLFSGGVSSNILIKNLLQDRYNAIFATPEFSSDNASGAAILAMIKRGVI